MQERATNRVLQEELKKEQDKSSSNQEAVQRAEEAEALLKEQKQLCEQVLYMHITGTVKFKYNSW